MFDPEKVKRSVANANFGEGWYDYDVVDAEDYEKLLALYRDQELLLKRVDDACLIGCLYLPNVRLRD